MAFLREVFGPSKEEIWQKLCNEIGAQYVTAGIGTEAKVVAKVKEWTIILDSYSTYNITAQKTKEKTVTYTRIRAPYVNRDNFYFTIYRRELFSDIGKLFGMQDVKVGYTDFDRDFIIKGNNVKKLKKLFANEKIRNLISSQPDIHLCVKDDEGCFGKGFPEGVDELYFEVKGLIKDIERLKSLYELFAEVLNHLCIIGSAYEDSPGLEL